MPNSAAVKLPPFPPPIVTWICDEVINLTPPPQHSVSVLLREVGRGNGHSWYAWWAAAGRDGEMAASIEYRRNGKNTIRIDIPQGQPLSSDYLQMWLLLFWQHFPHGLPGDPPIIKH
jgi:hypothetical protein